MPVRTLEGGQRSGAEEREEREERHARRPASNTAVGEAALAARATEVAAEPPPPADPAEQLLLELQVRRQRGGLGDQAIFQAVCDKMATVQSRAARERIADHPELVASYIRRIAERYRYDIAHYAMHGTHERNAWQSFRRDVALGHTEAVQRWFDEKERNPGDEFMALRSHRAFHAQLRRLGSELHLRALVAWGLAEARDPATEEREHARGEAELTPAELQLSQQTFNGLLQSTAARLEDLIDDWFTSESGLAETCRNYAAAVARDDFGLPGTPRAKLRSYLRVRRLNPGQALADHYQRTYGKSLRAEIGSNTGNNQHRRECERILGMRLDSAAVGTDPAEAPEPRRVPMAQAISEVLVDGQTLSVFIHAKANRLNDELGEWFLGGPDRDEVDQAWNEVSSAVRRSHAELCQLTGRAPTESADALALQLLVNAYREVGGSLKEDVASGLSREDRQRSSLARILNAPTTQPSVAEQRAAQAGEEAQQLFSALNRLTAVHADSAIEAVGAQIRPHLTQAESPLAVAYQQRFGITLTEHARRVAMALGRAPGPGMAVPRRDARSAAALLGLPAGVALDLQEAAGPRPSLQGREVGFGFTIEEATRIATNMWQAIQQGELQHVSRLWGEREPADERELIDACFRQLSGGIDWRFYFHSARDQQAATGRAVLRVGMEGSEAGAELVPQRATGVVRTSSSELDSGLAVAEEGRVTPEIQLRSYITNRNMDGIFALLDRITPDERRAILANDVLLSDLREACNEHAWDRVYQTLTEQADLYDRLESRAHGEYGFFQFLDFTDEEGMRQDIRAHIARTRTEHWPRLQEAVRSERPGASGEEVEQEVTRRFRELCLQMFADPAVRRILESEMDGLEQSRTESMFFGDGEVTAESELWKGDDWTWNQDEMLAALRRMTPEERASLLDDPGFRVQLQTVITNEARYNEAMALLASSEAAGAIDPIVELDRLTNGRSGWDDMTRSDGDILALLAALTPSQYMRLQAQPELQQQILRALDTDERAAARQLMSFTFTAGESVDPAVRRAEILAFLRFSAVNQIERACERGWDNLLEAAVNVYKMDFDPPAGQDEGEALAAIADQVVDSSDEAASDSPVDAAAGAAMLRVAEGQGQTMAPVEASIAGATRVAATPSRQEREAVWAEVAPEVQGWTRRNGGDGGRTRMVQRAILGEEDPSSERIRANSGSFNDDEEAIEETLRQASDQVLIDEWTTVRARPVGGGATLAEVYARYRDARNAARDRGATVPENEPEVAPLRIAFTRYTIDISQGFEDLVLPIAGGMFADREETEESLIRIRDNQQWHEWSQIVRQRAEHLDPGLVAGAIGATDPADRALIANPTRSTLMREARREREFLSARGTQARGMFDVAQGEAEALEFAAIDYGRAISAESFEDQEGERGTLREAQAGSIEELQGVRFDQALGDYRTARDKTAMVAGLVAAVLISAVVTILTGGLAAGPLGIILMGAITGAAGAAGNALTQELVRTSDYDFTDEGTREIFAGAVTGALVMGSSFWAGRMMTNLMNLRALGGAGRAAQVVTASGRPRLLQIIAVEGAEEVVSESVEGLMDVLMTVADPSRFFLHGWEEGMRRAMDAGQERLLTIPGTALNAFLQAGAINLGARMQRRAGHSLSRWMGRDGQRQPDLNPGRTAPDDFDVARAERRAGDAADVDADIGRAARRRGDDGPEGARRAREGDEADADRARRPRPVDVEAGRIPLDDRARLDDLIDDTRDTVHRAFRLGGGSPNLRHNFREFFVEEQFETVLEGFVQYVANCIIAGHVDLDSLGEDLLLSYLEELQYKYIGIHSRHAGAGITRRQAERDLEQYGDVLTDVERRDYLYLRGLEIHRRRLIVSRGDVPGVATEMDMRTYLSTRRSLMDAAIARTNADGGPALTTEQQDAFIELARNTPSGAAFSALVTSDLRSIPEVVNPGRPAASVDREGDEAPPDPSAAERDAASDLGDGTREAELAPREGEEDPNIAQAEVLRRNELLATFAGSSRPGSCKATCEQLADRMLGADSASPIVMYGSSMHYHLRAGDVIIDPTLNQFFAGQAEEGNQVFVGTAEELRAHLERMAAEFGFNPALPEPPSVQAMFDFLWGNTRVAVDNDTLRSGAELRNRLNRVVADDTDDDVAAGDSSIRDSGTIFDGRELDPGRIEDNARDAQAIDPGLRQLIDGLTDQGDFVVLARDSGQFANKNGLLAYLSTMPVEYGVFRDAQTGEWYVIRGTVHGLDPRPGSDGQPALADKLVFHNHPSGSHRLSGADGPYGSGGDIGHIQTNRPRQRSSIVGTHEGTFRQSIPRAEGDVSQVIGGTGAGAVDAEPGELAWGGADRQDDVILVNSSGLAVYRSQALARAQMEELVRSGVARYLGPADHGHGDRYQFDTVHGPVEVRIMQDGGTGAHKPRIVVVRAGTRRQYVNPDGSDIRGAVPKDQRARAGHLHGMDPNVEPSSARPLVSSIRDSGAEPGPEVGSGDPELEEHLREIDALARGVNGGFPSISSSVASILRSLPPDHMVQVNLDRSSMRVTAREAVRRAHQSGGSLRIEEVPIDAERTVDDAALSKLPETYREFTSAEYGGQIRTMMVVFESGEIASFSGNRDMWLDFVADPLIARVEDAEPPSWARPVRDIPVEHRVEGYDPTAKWAAELGDGIAYDSTGSDLAGMVVFHGTTEGMVESILAGPKNVGTGLGGQGLYLALETDRALAEEYMGHAITAGKARYDNNPDARGDAARLRGVVMEGRINPDLNLRIGRFRVSRDQRRADLANGHLPGDWDRDPTLVRFMNDNFDAIEVIGASEGGFAIGSDRFLVLHASAGADAIQWRPVMQGAAAAIAGTDFHATGGEQRATAEVGAEGARALPRVAELLPAGQLEVTELGATLHIDGQSVTVSVEVDDNPQSGGAVAEFVLDGDRAVIRLSAAARPEHIERAVAHEIFEMSAILRDRAAGIDTTRPDVLSPGTLDGELSAHDVGRIGELAVLTRMRMEAGSEGTYEIAKQQALELMDALGLGPEDGTRANRLAMVQRWLDQGLIDGTTNQFLIMDIADEASRAGPLISPQPALGQDYDGSPLQKPWGAAVPTEIAEAENRDVTEIMERAGFQSLGGGAQADAFRRGDAVVKVLMNHYDDPSFAPDLAVVMVNVLDTMRARFGPLIPDAYHAGGRVVVQEFATGKELYDLDPEAQTRAYANIRSLVEQAQAVLPNPEIVDDNIPNFRFDDAGNIVAWFDPVAISDFQGLSADFLIGTTRASSGHPPGPSAEAALSQPDRPEPRDLEPLEFESQPASMEAPAGPSWAAPSTEADQWMPTPPTTLQSLFLPGTEVAVVRTSGEREPGWSVVGFDGTHVLAAAPGMTRRCDPLMILRENPSLLVGRELLVRRSSGQIEAGWTAEAVVAGRVILRNGDAQRPMTLGDVLDLNFSESARSEPVDVQAEPAPQSLDIDPAVQEVIDRFDLPLVHGIQVGAASYRTSDVFDLGGGRLAVIAEVRVGDDCTYQVFYRSNSQGVFRILPARNSRVLGRLGLPGYDKGIGEHALDLPPTVQAFLARQSLDQEARGLGDDGSGDEVLRGVIPYNETIEDYARYESSPNHVKNHVRTETVETSAPGSQPNFGDLVTSYPMTTALAGPVEALVYRSRDGSLLYTIYKDAANHIWVGGIASADSGISALGVASVAVVPSDEDLLLPLWEYHSQIPGEAGETHPTNPSYASAWPSLAQMPLIRDWYRATGTTMPDLPLKSAGAPASDTVVPGIDVQAGPLASVFRSGLVIDVRRSSGEVQSGWRVSHFDGANLIAEAEGMTRRCDPVEILSLNPQLLVGHSFAVRRTSGTLEPGWVAESVLGVDRVRMRSGDMTKDVSIRDLLAANGLETASSPRAPTRS